MKYKITIYFLTAFTAISGFMNYSLCSIDNLLANSDSMAVDSLSSANLYTDASGLDMIIRGVFSLAVIMVLIVVLVYFMKKFIYNRKGVKISNELVTILDTAYIAPKKSIQILKILNKIVVVGVTENQIQPLTEFSEEELPISIMQNKKQIDGNFSKYLSVFLEKFKKNNVKDNNS